MYILQRLWPNGLEPGANGDEAAYFKRVAMVDTKHDYWGRKSTARLTGRDRLKGHGARRGFGWAAEGRLSAHHWNKLNEVRKYEYMLMKLISTNTCS